MFEKRGVRLNKEIDINKFNKSITFQNRGIGFTQIGIAGEILDLIDDLQQENKKLKDNWNKLKEYILENSYLDLAGNRCWINKHSAKNVLNILEQGSDSNDSNK